MDYDVENLELEIIKTSLSDIDLNVIDKDYDEIESKTKSSNYDTIKPKGLIESLELTEISSLKDKTNKIIDDINSFVQKVEEFDNSTIPDSSFSSFPPYDPGTEEQEGGRDKGLLQRVP